MAISLEIESKNMTNFFRFDRRIISSDKFRVTLSAVKMLALSIIRKILETSPPATLEFVRTSIQFTK